MDKVINKQDYDAFFKAYAPKNITTLNVDGENAAISELERNALECILKAGMFAEAGEGNYIVDEKMYAMYFAVHHFMETGNHMDAFDLYCVYSGAFLNDEGDQLQNMMNFVASYENGAARLVQSHRDHYVHSAYVFVLGLALFNTQSAYRKAFQKSYSYACKKDTEAYAKFVDLWGMTALFHDIGYQYEIPFNQIKENNWFEYYSDSETSTDSAEKRCIYLHYENMDKYTDLMNLYQAYGSTLKYQLSKELIDDELKKLVDGVFTPGDIEDVLAYHMKRKLSERAYIEWESVASKLRQKNTPKEFFDKKEAKYNAFMDHAYYSGVRLFKQMVFIYGRRFCVKANRLAERMDAITAITMHNKFFEFELSNHVSMKMEEHPLAYLLILCDELQCWDRTSFGKSSVKQFHAIDCEFVFDDGEATAKYIFDDKNDAIKFENGKIKSVVSGPLDKFLKNKDKKYIDEINPQLTQCWRVDDCSTWQISSEDFPAGDDTKFLCSINEIVDCTSEGGIALGIKAEFKKTRMKYCKEYLTTIGMEDVYKIAEVSYNSINAEKKFDDSSRMIQDKLHDIMMVKALGEILNAAGCFALKEQKAFDRITDMKDWSADEKESMCTVMMKKQEAFLTENRIVLGDDVVKIVLGNLHDDSEKWLNCLLKTILSYPGIEVYRIS